MRLMEFVLELRWA